MKKQYDFKKEWEKTKVQLHKFSKEAARMAKKGEDELVKFSKKGKLHIDSTAVSLKKEHLYYLIGKEYSKIKDPGEQSPSMKKLIGELHKVEKEQRSVQSSIKRKTKTKPKSKKN